MRKRKDHGNYEFQELKITYGGATYSVSGNAEWEVEDHGIGRYEFWGEIGHDHNYVASFFTADLEDISLEEKTEYGKQTLTEEDKVNIAEIVVDALNEDSELCSELAENFK
jgi:hypothetical protein